MLKKFRKESLEDLGQTFRSKTDHPISLCSLKFGRPAFWQPFHFDKIVTNTLETIATNADKKKVCNKGTKINRLSKACQHVSENNQPLKSNLVRSRAHPASPSFPYHKPFCNQAVPQMPVQRNVGGVGTYYQRRRRETCGSGYSLQAQIKAVSSDRRRRRRQGTVT